MLPTHPSLNPRAVLIRASGFAVLALIAVTFSHGGFAHGVVGTPIQDAQALTRTLTSMGARYRAAGPTERRSLEAGMVASAASRLQLLGSMMSDHPGEVLATTLPLAVRSALPSSLAAYVEQDAVIDGTLEILHEDAETGSSYHFFIHSTSGRQSLHFAGRTPDHLTTGARVRVKGVQVQDMLALGDTTTSMQQLAAAPSPIALGEQRSVVILVNFLDAPIQPYTVESARSAIFDATSAFFLENSYQQTWLAGDIVGWFTIPVSSATCDYASIASYAQSAATAAGVNLASYTHQVYAFPSNACGWWGLSSVGGSPSQSWINGAFELPVLAHELGHGHGLWHSHSLDCGATAVIGSSCVTNEYGDIVDVMGAGEPAHFNAFQKERLGWLNYGVSPPITTVSTDGAYTIGNYETAGSAAKALKIFKSKDAVTGQSTWFYVESRQASGFDDFLSDPSTGAQNVTGGLLVHIGTDASGNSSFLLDMTPATSVAYWWYDPALAAGQTFTDPDTGTTITASWVNSAGAGVAVKFGKPATNSPALSLSTSQPTYARGQTASITAKMTTGGAPVAKAAVTFTIIKSNGSSVTARATTASNGIAVYKLRLSKQDPVGIYHANGNATASGKSAAAATTFSVR